MYPQTKNIVLGAGHIYFDPFDTDGNPTGECYLAETSGVTLAVNSETQEIWSEDGAIAEKLVDVATRVTRDFKTTAKNINGDSIAMFIIGDVATQSTTTGAVTDQAINGGQGVLQGRWYQLGVTAGQPAGVRNISAQSIHDAVPNVYVEDTDYRIDLATSRIYIIEGGGIADDTVLLADYTRATTSWEEITSNDLGAKAGALRFVADNTAGINRDVFLPSVVMTPDGELSWKSRTDAQTVAFAVKINKPTDGRASVYVNGRAA